MNMAQGFAGWDGAASVAEVEASDIATLSAAAEPVVLRGLVADWPLVVAGRESLAAFGAYLRPMATAAQVETWVADGGLAGRFGYSDTATGVNFERWGMTFGDLLNLLGSDTPLSVYAGAVRIPEVLPELLDKLPVPLLSAIGDRLTSLWLGNGSRTRAHWDLPQNFACVVAGRRRFILMPPGQLPNLYVGPIDFTLAGQPSSMVDFDAPDLERFPRFSDAIASARVAMLEPGDAIYIPSMWWHHVLSPDRFGAQVNFWWRDAAEHMGTPLFALLHAITTVRELPAAERDAWRQQFEHYVFGAGADVAEHIPPEGRGILGPLTAESVAAVRQFIGSKLR